MAARVAARRAGVRGYAQSADKWKKGARPDAVLLGLIGERAARLWFYQAAGLVAQHNCGIRHAGDGGIDLSVGGVDVDVKTRGLGVGQNMVRLECRGRNLHLGAPVFLFAQEGIRTRMGWDVALLGWCRRSEVLSARRGQSHKFPVTNAYIPDKHLRCLRDLVTEVCLCA